MATRLKSEAAFIQLRSEVRDLQQRFTKLTEEDAFAAWFIRAYLLDSEEGSVDTLTGAAGDKGVDAAWVDDDAHRVFLLQSKFRKKILGSSENRSEVLGFSDLPEQILGSPDEFKTF